MVALRWLFVFVAVACWLVTIMVLEVGARLERMPGGRPRHPSRPTGTTAPAGPGR